MSVDVTLLPATIPPRLQDEDISRIRQYRDREGQDPVTFSYRVAPSGALVIYRYAESSGFEVETTIGPAAWEEVTGDQAP